MAVLLLITRVGQGFFRVGLQADAQEYLYTLLDNLTQASFGYLQGVPLSYEKQTFLSKLFQGKFERETICSLCKSRSIKVDDFLNLSLVSVSALTLLCVGRAQTCQRAP